ncbi:ABC transporter permease [Devosia pacifica]|uniref:ABC transporter permease n=1 Tax=Devosia pacifica TaxID=1335967 RepID=UPI001FCECFB3|nr:ABC transporter permease subunit [Devosia pacifica]
MRAEPLARLGWFVASFSALVLVWAIVSTLVDQRYLPSPGAVLTVMLAETADGDLPFHLSMTLMRVAFAFVLAMAIGGAIGMALGARARLDRFFLPWLIVALNLPALVVIVLSYIWFGLTEAAAIGAVAVNKIPMVAATLREGTRALDPLYSEMAKVFRFSWVARLRHVVLPQLQPYYAAAARSGIALIWKIVLVVELLGRSNGIGFQVHLYFQMFDVAGILAYALAFVLVMLAIDGLLLQPFERHARRWRTVNA